MAQKIGTLEYDGEIYEVGCRVERDMYTSRIELAWIVGEGGKFRPAFDIFVRSVGTNEKLYKRIVSRDVKLEPLLASMEYRM